jgi:hypothetical protein
VKERSLSKGSTGFIVLRLHDLAPKPLRRCHCPSGPARL